MDDDKVVTQFNKLARQEQSIDSILKASNKVVIKPSSSNRYEKMLLVLFDGSGSMFDKMGSDIKIVIAWNVLKNDLMSNLAGWDYGILIVQGYDKLKWLVQPTQDTTKPASMITPTPVGGTPIKLFLVESWKWLKEHTNSARMILLTDGCPTDSSKEMILELAAQHTGIPIDTVGIGAGTLEYDAEFLRNLSEVTGGIFVEASSASMLSEQIKKLAPSNRPLLGKVEK